MRYGCFCFGKSTSLTPYRTFEFSELADNVDKLNKTNLKHLASALNVPNRSKKDVGQLIIDCRNILRTTTSRGSENINDCLSDSHPESNRLWTVDEFVSKYQ